MDQFNKPPHKDENVEERLQALLAPYIEKLGINWKIQYQQHYGLIAIVTNPEDQFHTIYYHKDLWHNPSRYLPSLLHELSHAYLVETIDPSFVGMIPPHIYIYNLKKIF